MLTFQRNTLMFSSKHLKRRNFQSVMSHFMTVMALESRNIPEGGLQTPWNFKLWVSLKVTSLKTQRVLQNPPEESEPENYDTESNSDMNFGINHSELPLYNGSTTLTADPCSKKMLSLSSIFIVLISFWHPDSLRMSNFHQVTYALVVNFGKSFLFEMFLTMKRFELTLQTSVIWRSLLLL